MVCFRASTCRPPRSLWTTSIINVSFSASTCRPPAHISVNISACVRSAAPTHVWKYFAYELACVVCLTCFVYSFTIYNQSKHNKLLICCRFLQAPPGSFSSSRFLQVAPPGSSRFLQVTPCLPGSSRFLFVPPGFSWFLQVSPGSFSDQVKPKDERFVFKFEWT